MWFGIAPSASASPSRTTASPWRQQQAQRARYHHTDHHSHAQKQQVALSPRQRVAARDDHRLLPAATASPSAAAAAAAASPRRTPLRASALFLPAAVQQQAIAEGGRDFTTRPPTTATSTSRRVAAASKQPQDEEEKGNGASSSNNAAVAEPEEPEFLAAEPADSESDRRSLRSGARRTSRVAEHVQSVICPSTVHTDTWSSNSEGDGHSSESIEAPPPPKSRRSSRAYATLAAANASELSASSTDHEYLPLERQLHPENLVGHTSGVCSVIAGDDRYIVSCSMDRSVKVWSRASLACLHTLFGHADNVSCVDLNARYLVSGSHDTTLRVYTCVAGFKLLHVLSGHTAHVTKVHLPAAQPQQIVSCSDDAAIRVWDGELGSCQFVLHGHTSRITCMLMDGGRVCSGAADSAVIFWDLPAAPMASLKRSDATSNRQRHQCRTVVANDSDVRAARVFHVHKATVQVLAANCQTDCTLVLSGSNDGTIQIFNFQTAEYVGCLDHVHSPIYSMCLLSNGQLLCSTGDGRLLHFSDLFSHPLEKSELRLASKWISMLQPRGRIVVCSSEDLLYIVDAEQLHVLAVIESNHGFVNSVSWLHEKALISGGQDNVVKVWSIA